MTGNSETTARSDRAAGVLLGLASGDALGRPVEFSSAEQIERTHGRVTEMLSRGTHNKPAGTITDDAELALHLAASLVTSAGFDPADVGEQFVAWYDAGPFDMGMMTSSALRKLQGGGAWHTAGVDVWEKRAEGQNAGNGSVMRCAPNAVAFADRPDELVSVSLVSSALTHADPRCTYGCAILNRTLAGLIRGEDQPLEAATAAVESHAPPELLDAVTVVPDDIGPSELESSGYVVSTLQTGLYHGLTADSAREAIADAVNMGRDTDTVGAVTGAVAGARFGASGLPDSWLGELRVENAPTPFQDERSCATVLRETARELDQLDATVRLPSVSASRGGRA